MIAIIDYGLNNVRSVANALGRLNVKYVIASEPTPLQRADGVILPGVGAFAAGMCAMRAAGLDDALREAAQRVPVLGICLGMQMLAASSDEAPGGEAGLGIINRRANRLPRGVKVPHVGWNRVQILQSTCLLRDLGEAPYMYFTHSYYLPPAENDSDLAVTEYGVRFASVLREGNIWGVQFHPEKSGHYGSRLLRNFVRLAGRCEDESHPSD